MDSICRKCYATVRNAFWEADLEAAEQMHVCDPATLEYWSSRPFPLKTSGPPIQPVPLPAK